MSSHIPKIVEEWVIKQFSNQSPHSKPKAIVSIGLENACFLEKSVTGTPLEAYPLSFITIHLNGKLKNKEKIQPAFPFSYKTYSVENINFDVIHNLIASENYYLDEILICLNPEIISPEIFLKEAAFFKFLPIPETNSLYQKENFSKEIAI